MRAIQKWFAANAWRGLALMAIIGEAGISGSFLAGQMKSPLPYQYGFYLALVQGLATFGGVDIAQKGNRKGWAVVAISGTAGVVFSFMFFGGMHDIVIGTIMGIFPTGVAIMAGLIDSSQQQAYRKEQEEKDDKEFERQRIRDADRAKQEREAERDRLRVQFKLEELRTKQLMLPADTRTDGNSHADGQGRSVSASGRTEVDRADFAAWLTANPSATGADVAARFNVSDRTGRRWLIEARAGADSKGDN